MVVFSFLKKGRHEGYHKGIKSDSESVLTAGKSSGELSNSNEPPHSRAQSMAIKLLISSWLACFICIVLNVSVLAVECVYGNSFVPVATVPLLSLILAVVVVGMEICRRQKKFKELLQNKGYFFHLWSVLRFAIIFVILGITICYIVVNMSGTIKNPLNLSNEANDKLNLSYTDRLTIVVLSMVAMASNIVVLFHVWRFSKVGRTQIFMAFACVLNFVIAVAEVKISYDTNTDLAHNNPNQSLRLPLLYVFTGAFVLCGAFLGLLVSTIVNEKNRLSDTIGHMLFLQDGFNIVIAILCVISGIDTVARQHVGGYHVPTSLLVLYWYSFFDCLIIICCSRLSRARRPPKLQVEELDFVNLTEAQKSAYAKLITYNKKANPGVSGEAALLLMEAYCRSTLENMTCRVLRVYKPESEKNTEVQKVKKRDTWDIIDREATIYDEEATLAEKPLEEPQAPKPLSKNQKKKLAKKAAANGGKFPLDLPTEQDIKEEAKFHADLMATEALVLYTTIDNYDLTKTLTGRFGRYIQRTFGEKSKSKLLCIRIGLLAFHWPFIRSTFYCKGSDKPVASSAAIMHAIGKWNNSLGSSKRSAALLDPMVKNGPPEQGIHLGGWFKIKLPASHIIDLRPHKGKTAVEYLKSIKYRFQDGDFRRAKGETIEVKDFDDESCQAIIDLWRNIADGRSEGGYTATLAAPDAKFIKDIGTISNNKKDRSLLFLKVNGEVIASCVLFRVGDTITSDIQGLDHEKARPMKGYFVMMQEVIGIALKEGKNFVDFGPTTEKPKLNIGCKSVPLTGALHTRFSALSLVVLIAASHVKV